MPQYGAFFSGLLNKIQHIGAFFHFMENAEVSRVIQLFLGIRTSAFSIKWKNILICCTLFSKLEKNAQKLSKVKCLKVMFLESKA